MLKILRSEIKQSFSNKLFIVSLIISTILVLWFSIERFSFCIDANNTFSTSLVKDNFLEISYTNWLGANNIYLQQNIFYLIIPFLAALPFSGSLFDDIHKGMIKNICIRTSKRSYLVSKYIAVFISGGSVTTIPLAFSFILSTAFLPTMTPEVSYAYTNIFSSDKWADLLFVNPLLYVVLYLLLTFVFSGLLACTSLFITYFINKKFVCLVFPFFVYIISSLFFELMNLNNYSLRNIIVTSTTDMGCTTEAVIIVATALFVLTFVPYLLIGEKKDVL